MDMFTVGDVVEHRNAERRAEAGIGRVIENDLGDLYIRWADGTFSWIGADAVRRVR